MISHTIPYIKLEKEKGKVDEKRSLFSTSKYKIYQKVRIRMRYSFSMFYKMLLCSIL